MEDLTEIHGEDDALVSLSFYTYLLIFKCAVVHMIMVCWGDEDDDDDGCECACPPRRSLPGLRGLQSELGVNQDSGWAHTFGRVKYCCYWRSFSAGVHFSKRHVLRFLAAGVRIQYLSVCLFG